MGLRNAQYHAIMREYEKEQLKSHDIQTARYEEVYTKLPEFKSLDDSISILSVQVRKRSSSTEIPTALSSLKEELALLRASKKKLLTSCRLSGKLPLNRFMNVPTARIPVISVMKNVIALKKPS